MAQQHHHDSLSQHTSQYSSTVCYTWEFFRCYDACCLVRGRGGVAELAQMYPRVSQGNVKCCPGISHTECAYAHIYKHIPRSVCSRPWMYAESYIIHAPSVCRGPGLCQDSRIARNSMLYSLTMYILRFYAAAMDVMRYQVASGVDMACVYLSLIHI